LDKKGLNGLARLWFQRKKLRLLGRLQFIFVHRPIFVAYTVAPPAKVSFLLAGVASLLVDVGKGLLLWSDGFKIFL